MYIYYLDNNILCTIIYCYILIIPGFGIISHVIGTMSDKSVFGQCGPKRNYMDIYKFFSQRTICRELIDYNIKLMIWNILLSIWQLVLDWKSKVQNTRNVSNKIYSVLVKIFVYINNPQITNARVILLSKSKIRYFFGLSMSVGISEAIRLLLTIINRNIHYILKICIYELFIPQNVYLYASPKFSGTTGGIISIKEHKFNEGSNENPLNEWLAGVIDGDGCFLLSKKGYASLEITIQLRDVRCLNIIKQNFGGSIKVRANENHLRYRLHHKVGLLNLISAINGLIRIPIRMLQLAKICEKYEIPFLYPKPLVYHNGWLSGFFDTDGSVYLNLVSDQMFVTVGQKNKLLLDQLPNLYGGSVYLSKGNDNFKWVIYRKQEVIKILEYFKLYPLRSAKLARIKLIPKYHELRSLGAHKAKESTVLGKSWKRFLVKWDNFGKNE